MDGAGHVEQSLADFLPKNMELVVLANSPIGATHQFFRDVVTHIYLANITPEIPVGGWVARHGLSGAQYQQAFDQFTQQGYVPDWVSGYNEHGQPLFAAIWTK